MTGMTTVAFVYDEELRTWAAYIPGVGAYGEGETKEAALEDLKKAIALYIEEMGQEAFLDRIDPKAEYEDVPLSTFAAAA